MSEKQPALANLPPIPAWAVYGVLALAGLGGTTGTLSTALQVFTPQANVSAEIAQLRKDVDAQGASVRTTAESVETLNRALGSHVASDAGRDLTAADLARRVQTLENRQIEVTRRLDQIRVNQLVICRTLKAPCGND